MARQLPDVDCKYGAPMGRPSYCNNEMAKVRLFRVNMIDCGAYDEGGAYWGIGTPLYCAKADGVMLFRRANSRAEAKASVLANHPGLTFFR